MPESEDREVEITDENMGKLLPTLVGKVVASIERAKDSGESWGHGENSVSITFTDGTELEFNGWGYDASGLITYLTTGSSDA